MKDKIIEKYLTNQNYHQIEIKDCVYFVKNIGDEYADIRFDKDTGWCGISYELVSFFSRMMGIKLPDIQEVIGRWVEHTLQMEVKETYIGFKKANIRILSIPYKWRRKTPNNI